MEKILSAEERIRKAEEIYYKRKMQSGNNNCARVNVSDNTKDFGMLKKIFLQILISIVIYAIFYMIKNTNYIFSDKVINKTKEILSYDINIQKLYNTGINYLNSFKPKQENNTESSEEKEDKLEEENMQEKESNVDIDAIGGENIEQISEEVPLTQMEQDAKDILNSKSLIIPLEGVITSRFGIRESTNPIVTKNHTGIDIAANEGTIFIASMDGIVEEISSVGDLGNHIKIANDNIETVYAHCKTIYVKEGEKITQGQNLGEVGQTRQCYWSTLAF